MLSYRLSSECFPVCSRMSVTKLSLDDVQKELKIYIPKRGVFRKDIEYVADIVNDCLKDLCAREMSDGHFDGWEIDYCYGNGDGTFVVRDSKGGDTEPVNNLVCSIGFGTF